MSDEHPSYILRVQKEELERQLFSRHTFYVGIKRDWTPGALVLFVKKDAFVCSGVIDRFVALEQLNEPDKRLAIENSWYGWIMFASLARFVPAVPLRDTPAAGQNPLALHGSVITNSEALQIEYSVRSRIIS